MLKVLCKLLLIIGAVMYLVFALTKWNKDDTSHLCKTIDIAVNDSSKAGFITTGEVERILRQHNLYPIDKRMDFIDTYKIEKTLLTNPFVLKVNCYKTAGDKVRIDVQQRLPLLRVITDKGESYFIDRNGKIMPRMHYAADLVIATGNISKKYAQKHLFALGKLLQNDAFLDNQIEQICVDSVGHIELIPRVGDHIIYIGAPIALEKKFSHLKTFYKKVLSEVGWNKYSVINLEYTNQIICKKKLQQ